MFFNIFSGYEDARKKSSDGSYLAEIKNYTHAAEDSLRGTSKILLVSCLNPSFCQDTIYMVSLASRSCHWICRAFLDSTKRNASSAKQMIPKSVSGMAKKLHGSSKLLDKEVVTAKNSAIKGRKLFDEACHSATQAEKVLDFLF
ncbi:Kinesin-like protein KIN-10C [Glycine soja]